MDIIIEAFSPGDIGRAIEIWNRVVADGVAFPQEEELGEETGLAFFAAQSYTGVARDAQSGEIVGLYILHPNNVGRCGHICNASYAVQFGLRGRRIGEALVRDCLKKAKELGFRLLQFNAVVVSNEAALRLYDKLGFTRLGTVPGGFRLNDGRYEDIALFYHEL